MPERLTIITMGKQTIAELLEDRIFGVLHNLPLNATDDERAKKVAWAIVGCEGRHEQWEDHGNRYEKATHQ